MTAIQQDIDSYPEVMPSGKRKTSFVVDFDKVAAVREALGTKTLTDTVDAALSEVLTLERRKQLVEMLFGDGYELDLHKPEVMARAWVK